MSNNLKKIDANIAQVRSMGTAFNALIHDTAVLIMKHAEEHGDCSRAQQLVMAMPASMRRTSLIAWFTDYSPIVTKNDEAWNARMHKPETALGKPNPMYRPFNVEAAENDPFWKHAERNQESNAKRLEFSDIVKMVEQLGQRIEKQIEDGVVVDEDLEAAKNVALTIQGLHFTKIRKDAETAVQSDNKAQLTDARKRYQQKFGKRAFAGWTLETLEQKLTEEVEGAAGRAGAEPAAAAA
jgi:hypothetical protein